MKAFVALLAEGVDRNTTPPGYPHDLPGSPSSRRAWIEIHDFACVRYHARVALLAEGVDRNSSPSAKCSG